MRTFCEYWCGRGQGSRVAGGWLLGRIGSARQGLSILIPPAPQAALVIKESHARELPIPRCPSGGGLVRPRWLLVLFIGAFSFSEALRFNTETDDYLPICASRQFLAKLGSARRLPGSLGQIHRRSLARCRQRGSPALQKNTIHFCFVFRS